MKYVGLICLLMSLVASAESPFSLRSKIIRFKDGVPILDEPNTESARVRATEDLLGIEHFRVVLNPDNASGEPYQLKLVQHGEPGHEKVLQQVSIKGAGDPLGGVGVSILPGNQFVRVKVYTTKAEAVHEVPAKKFGKIESGNGGDGVLMRYMVDGAPLWTLLWSKEDKSTGD